MGTIGEPTLGKGFLEKLQDQHCDETRTTSKRFRVMRNVGESAPYFPEDEPILCVGSGDGFEVQAWKLLGFDVSGYEISSSKIRIAAKHSIATFYQGLEKLYPYNIYCAHTIEHFDNSSEYIRIFSKLAISTVCLIFPIEPYGSNNPSHLSPVGSIHDIDLPGFKIMLKKERWNDEREGIIIWKRKVVR
jgi:hypothetical protein